MITEFTCGSFKVHKENTVWALTINQYPIASIKIDGSIIQYNQETNPMLSIDDLIEIAVLMNNIKRQYKQLQVNQQG